MTTFAVLQAEVADLEARKGTLNKEERVRIIWARKALAETPEQIEINKARSAAQVRFLETIIQDYHNGMDRLAGGIRNTPRRPY